MNAWTFGVQVFVTLFVIMDPPGVVPIYLGLVSPFTEKERRKLAEIGCCDGAVDPTRCCRIGF